MTAMELLRRCRAGMGDLSRLSGRLQRLEECATGATSRLDRNGGRGPQTDKMSVFAAAMDEAQRALDERRKAYDAELLAACQLVDRLNEPFCGVMYRYYIQGQTISGIAVALKFSQGYVKQLKSAGAAELSAIPAATIAAMLPEWYLTSI